MVATIDGLIAEALKEGEPDGMVVITLRSNPDGMVIGASVYALADSVQLSVAYQALADTLRKIQQSEEIDAPPERMH